ncbi:MAG: DUF2064 domain-containing protein [Methylotenera sp.]|nr:DUF2064 domain-containing protein [Methylotenera sp.]MDP1755401.1 DUF2064 domain-containing protein [Methylotenera sp.]MDP1959580.1 DUF2064 domain-containing protein [Methylotenera sp.]MDP3206885.1 DUF2064 domain-containing protein [Methylotenera sp.]MDP3303288.1 DUF2064 domain-containing protein [Methylotenera sp.]
MTQPTLVLVCKRPSLGVGKQRLATKVGQALALKIAEALLACTMEDVLAWYGTVVIAPADIKDREWAVDLCKKTRADAAVLPQVSGNLGQRLNALDHALRSSGFNQLIYIGSDAPDIGITDYTAVSDAFLNVDTMFKPTIDGGVSIMASCKPWPDLTHLPWSTSQLGDGLSLLCQQNGHVIGKLPVGFDVDEFEDLSHLVVKLAQDQRPARRVLLALARQIIQQKTSKQKVMMPNESRYA